MSAPSAPSCPGCGRRPEPGNVICKHCIALVPGPERREIDKAWKALRARPTSPSHRRDYDVAIAEAVEAIK